MSNDKKTKEIVPKFVDIDDATHFVFTYNLRKWKKC